MPGSRNILNKFRDSKVTDVARLERIRGKTIRSDIREAQISFITL